VLRLSGEVVSSSRSPGGGDLDRGEAVTPMTLSFVRGEVKRIEREVRSGGGYSVRHVNLLAQFCADLLAHVDELRRAPDGGAEMTRDEAIAILTVAGIPADEIERVLVPDQRREAAERLARLVLDAEEEAYDGGMGIVRERIDESMVAEARKALGEK
jgi:hypothetical protein